MTEQIFKNEREFLNQVRKDARERGWKYFHERYSMGSDKGFPDLLMIHVGNEKKGIPPRYQMLVLELKTARNKSSDAQDEWIAAMRNAGVVAYVMYPKDHANIVRLLDGLDVIDVACDNVSQLELV